MNGKVLMILAGVVFGGTAVASEGGLDFEFGGDGRVLLERGAMSEFNGFFAGNGVALGTDGRVLVTGRADPNEVSPTMLLAAVEGDGSLAASFGNGGFAGGIAGESVGFDVAIAGDRIFVAGEFDGRFTVWRFLADGTADPSFGPDGSGRVSPGAGRALNLFPNQDGGTFAAGFDEDWNVMLLRLTPAGELDPAFADAGIVSFEIQGHGMSTDGKIITRLPDGSFLLAYGEDTRLVTVRLTAAGVLDESYGVGGYAEATIGGEGELVDWVSVHPGGGGRTLVIGYIGPIPWLAMPGRGFIYRLDPDGSGDASFGDGGLVTGEDWSLTLFRNASAIAGGGVIVIGTGEFPEKSTMLRLTETGAWDPGFGAAGKMVLDFGTGGIARQLALRDAAWTADGKLVVAGWATALGTFQPERLALARIGVDDGWYPGTIGATVDSVDVNEGQGTFSIDVRRAGGSSGAVAVSVETEKGEAVEGSDFTLETRRLEWQDGESGNKTVVVELLEDLASEGRETFWIRLSGPEGGARLATDMVWIRVADGANDAVSSPPSRPLETIAATPAGRGAAGPGWLVILLALWLGGAARRKWDASTD